MCNLNSNSQFSRILFGLALIVLAYFGPKTPYLSFELIDLWKIGWFGFVPLLSGIAAFCPIYAVLGCGHHRYNQK